MSCEGVCGFVKCLFPPPPGLGRCIVMMWLWLFVLAQAVNSTSDSENDWEIAEDPEATSDQGSEAAEEAASNSQASCSEAARGSDSDA